MSGEGDSDNPYRFTGGATTSGDDRPADPLRRLRKVARLRTAFIAATIVHCAGVTGALICFAISDAVDLGYVPDALANAALAATVCGYGGYAALLLVGVTLVPLGCPRIGPAMTLALVLPLANVGVAYFVARDSRRTLEAHGIRVGWLTSDFSQAIVEGLSPDSASAA